MHPGGEVAAAAAAGSAGIAYTLSTISGHKLENVRAASPGPVWYQLYLVGGRQVAEAAIERARRAGFSALVVTIDTPVAGMRERDPRNGIKELLGGSAVAKIPFLPQILAHPAWLAAFLLDGGVPNLENIRGRGTRFVGAKSESVRTRCAALHLSPSANLAGNREETHADIGFRAATAARQLQL